MHLKKFSIVLFGSFITISLVFYLVNLTDNHIWLASFASSTALLFTASNHSVSQPRALVGGHLICALVGITLFHFLGDAWWVLAISLSLGIFLMLATRTFHPPAAANTVIMIHAHASFVILISTILLGTLSLVIITAVLTRVMKSKTTYPTHWFSPSPRARDWGIKH